MKTGSSSLLATAIAAIAAIAACGGDTPPAELVSDFAGSEVLIAEFGSYTEGKPVPARVYGDAKLPLAGEVLGTAIHTQDAEELRYFVRQELTDRYAVDKGIGVTEEEKAAYVEHVRGVEQGPELRALRVGCRGIGRGQGRPRANRDGLHTAVEDQPRAARTVRRSDHLPAVRGRNARYLPHLAGGERVAARRRRRHSPVRRG